VRVVLGEDLTLLRDGLIRLLAAYDMEVVAAVDSGPELLRALVTHRPDVAVVDVRLPPTFTDEGLRAAIRARAQVPGLPVLVLSQHVEQLYAKELLSAGTGGLGYLLKDRVSDVRRFIDAVRTVAGGGTAMDPEVVSQLLVRHGRDGQLSRLTTREREVLALMAEGHSNAGIAARLVITEKAVTKNIGNIFTKLDLYPAEDANRRVLAVLTYLNALRLAVLTNGADLVRLGRAEVGVDGESLFPVVAGLAGAVQGVVGMDEAVVCAGLLVRVADVAGYLARGGVVGAGAAGLAGREKCFTEAVQCVGFTGPVADLLVQGQGLLEMISGLLVSALLPVDARNIHQYVRFGGVVAGLAGGCAGAGVDGDGFLGVAAGGQVAEQGGCQPGGVCGPAVPGSVCRDRH